MLTDLINQLITTIHDFITHQSASTDVQNIVTTAEDVVGIIPEVTTPNAALVADAVNAALAVAKAAVPANASTAVKDAVAVASEVASAVEPAAGAAPAASS